jgi:hypothetical protein
MFTLNRRFAIKLIGLLPRNPTMRREDFVSYYENRHATFWNEALKDQLRTGTAEYRRSYITRRGVKAHGATNSPQWTGGEGDVVPFDCMAEFSFVQMRDYQRYQTIRQDPEISRIRTEDEAVLFDVSKRFLIYTAEVYQS